MATAQPLKSSGCDGAKGHFPFSGWETRLRSRSSLCEETWQRQMLSSRFPPLFLLIPFSCWSCGHGLRVAQGRAVISALFSNRGILYAPAQAGNTQYNPSGLIPPLSWTVSCVSVSRALCAACGREQLAPQTPCQSILFPLQHFRFLSASKTLRSSVHEHELNIW